MSDKAKIGVLGASGYTGAELVRLLIRHPRVEIVLLTADRRAGKTMADVFPQFAPYALPTLTSVEAGKQKFEKQNRRARRFRLHRRGIGTALRIRALRSLADGRSPCRQTMADVFPQFAPYALPTLTSVEEADWQALGSISPSARCRTAPRKRSSRI